MTEERTFGQRLLAIVHWRRLRAAAIMAGLFSLLLMASWDASKWVLLFRLFILCLMCVLAFGFWEQFPRRLPRWIARWVLQVVAVALTIPPTMIVIYVLSTPDGAPPLWQDRERLQGLAFFMVSGLLIGPWVALGALVRQKDALARTQALSFALERSELERRATDARLALMQAQVQPHFLFNTLANVRALVETGSPQALPVLDSLIAYLRAAVPRLNAASATMADELALVRAYLDIMRMRIPDRLSFRIDADPATLALPCPPMAVLTLVENAVRHGIDPAEEGGEIAVVVGLEGGVCHVRVDDGGLGLRPGTGGLGTGLTTLRQRLALAFGPTASLSLVERESGGVSARLSWPVKEAAA
ncbi:sensor histidine kinase [Niveispirillum sp. KHB5.9]|uniref:sensor histidine kinase n=1 Tax=Niveispirillum sp. KHB5.9 TaxID=3400269 RepID=UPI003A88E4A1